MPSKPLKPCRQPGCKNVTASLYCETHVLNKKDTKRGSAAKRGYGSRWQKYRRVYLINHPFCVECEKEDTITLATVVDHIVPHKGSLELFWDESNHQPLLRIPPTTIFTLCLDIMVSLTERLMVRFIPE